MAIFFIFFINNHYQLQYFFPSLKAAEFDSSKTIDETVSGIELRDGRVDEVQYRGFVEHWFSEKAQVSYTYFK